MKELRKEFNQISDENLVTISNVLRMVQSNLQGYRYCEDESSQNMKVFRNTEYEEGAGIVIDLLKDSFWFQDDSLFLQLGCMEDSSQRTFIENLVGEKLLKIVFLKTINQE